MNVFAWVGWGWIIRRAMEIGGIVGTLATFYMSLPEPTRAAVERAMSGRWQDVTLGALAPIAVALWAYVWSWRATTRPQVVTSDQMKAPLPQSAQPEVKEAVVRAAPRRKPSILETIFRPKR